MERINLPVIGLFSAFDVVIEESEAENNEKAPEVVEVEKEVVQRPQENIDEVQPTDDGSTESTHGGNEATKDIQNSPNPAEGGENSRQGQSDSDKNLEQSESQQQAKSGEAQSAEPQAEQSEEKSHSGSQKDSHVNHDGQKEAQAEDGAENSQAPEQSEQSEGAQKSIFEELLKKFENQELEDDEEDSQTSEWDKELRGRKNHARVFSKNPMFEMNIGKLRNLVAIMLRRLTEDSFIFARGDEEWDAYQLMTRFGTPPHRCKKRPVRVRVILALDFSGSCAAWSKFFLDVAQIALKFKDVEVVDASNGFNEERGLIEFLDEKHIQEALSEGEVQSSQRTAPLSYLDGRKVIFFGDFDGGASIVRLSRRAQVIWFSNEDRYEDMTEHSWCEGFSLKDFMGKYFKVLSVEDFERSIRKLR
ncbi:MAG: hypothetical protein P3W91_005130 [Fervidobacterium sp.]|nr:hypothetical protein [Fervidobacterium sp.]